RLFLFRRETNETGMLRPPFRLILRRVIMSNLRNQIAQLSSGAPRRTLTYKGNGYAVDETGKPYHVESVVQRETRRRIFAQKGAGRSESFVWSRLEGLPYVIDSLTTAQCGHLLMLSTYVDYDGLII